jgi:hypothetical protein
MMRRFGSSNLVGGFDGQVYILACLFVRPDDSESHTRLLSVNRPPPLIRFARKKRRRVVL